MKFSQIQDSDFFTFFHISQIEETNQTNGLIVRKFKPGGFQSEIDLEMHFTKEEVLKSAFLQLTHSWIGNLQHINAFAKDIAKSFLLLAQSEVSKPELAELADRLNYIEGLQDHVIYVQGKGPKRTPIPDDLRGAIAVFLGVEIRWEKEFGPIYIVFDNFEQNGIKKLQIQLRY
jgi:hypothetical protein